MRYQALSLLVLHLGSKSKLRVCKEKKEVVIVLWAWGGGWGAKASTEFNAGREVLTVISIAVLCSHLNGSQKILWNIRAERGRETCGNETMVYTTVKWVFSSVSCQQVQHSERESFIGLHVLASLSPRFRGKRGEHWALHVCNVT